MIEERSTDSLKPHPINERIYGDTYDHDLIKSIEEYGFRGTIEITKDDVIISGHRRWYVCQELEFETVPVTILEEMDPDTLIEYLITMNRSTRKRTNEQIAREFEVLLEVEERKAKERQVRKPKESVKENFPEQKNGQSRDKAADKLNAGWSGRTAETASNVIKYADKIEKKDPDAAKKIKDTLNTKSVNAAKNTVFEHQTQEKKKVTKKLNSPNENIEWAKWSWNPVTGCLHGCDYCYAKDIALRFDSHFKPTFHEDRLSAPEHTIIPKKRLKESGINNIFVCSMADLFGKWVDAAWIKKVIEICENQSQWNYLFLTKNPGRYLEFKFPGNCWLGASATNQNQYDNAVKTFNDISGNVKFLSCEPLNSEIQIKNNNISCIDWLIVGGRSRNSKMPAFQPDWKWVEHLLFNARKFSIPVYFKPNLIVRPKEYPVGL